MTYSVRFQVATLWRGDKGTKPHQFEYPPARSPFLDGYGVWFTTTANKELWIANVMHHSILRVHLRTKQSKWFQNPFASAFYPVGGCPATSGQSQDLIILLTASKRPAQVAHLSREMKVLSVLPLEGEVPFVPPTWIRVAPLRGSYLCSHRHFKLNGLVSEGQLNEYSMRTGERVQIVEGVTGAAIGQDGVVYVSGGATGGRGVEPVNPPRGLDPQRWLLVGVDSLQRLYWYSQVRDGRQYVSRLACGDKSGQLFWEVALTGSKGVLATIDPNLQIRLGWGCEWIEVNPSGQVEIFAWSDSSKVQSGVGVYRITIMDDSR
jgi:hypothetical protein